MTLKNILSHKHASDHNAAQNYLCRHKGSLMCKKSESNITSFEGEKTKNHKHLLDGQLKYISEFMAMMVDYHRRHMARVAIFNDGLKYLAHLKANQF